MPLTRARTGLVAAVAAVVLLPGGPGAGLSAGHCPHHDAPAAVLAVTAEPDAPVAADAGHGGSHGPCTCVGECCTSAAPSLVAPGPDRGAVVAGSVPVVPSSPAAAAPRPERTPHFPGYANPPPSAG